MRKQVLRPMWPVLVGLLLSLTAILVFELSLLCRHFLRTCSTLQRYPEQQDAVQQVDVTNQEVTEEREAPEGTIYTCQHVVFVRHMPRDGNSLLAALVLKLHTWSAGSPEHHEETTRLRHELVDYLRVNRRDFREQILAAVERHAPRYKDEPTAGAQVSRYLDDLAESGFPVDAELLGAVADVCVVDLVVYPEGGKVHTVPSSHLVVDQEVNLAHRLLEDTRGHYIDHFDAVEGVCLI
ncbi:hypothetical protein PR048_026812 [Dryococelus australis]|uniref:Uncharacterized protein n=1 Tax=Dryococelus australis TaxID=614101 RepID=A0ABQ9GME7_9NEOP|nr:hypothetical protein PR048_026812 [Dryococelus australis]